MNILGLPKANVPCECLPVGYIVYLYERERLKRLEIEISKQFIENDDCDIRYV